MASTTTSSSRPRSTTPIWRRSRPRSGASSTRGAPGSGRRSPPTKHARRFAAEGEPYKVELVDTADGPITLYTQGDVHRSLPGPASPDLRADQGLQAHFARRRLLARRREEHPADAHLRDRLLQPEGPRRAPRAAGAGDAREITGGSVASSTCSTSTSSRPGHRSGIRRGWRSSTRSRISAAARMRGAATRRSRRR